MTRKDLERLAIDAHCRGDTWADLWPTVATNVAKAEPWDARRYHRLVRCLLGLVVSGDTDGQQPAGDGWPRPCAWELDDLTAGSPGPGREMDTTSRKRGITS
ncbi:MAG: hypothetical protein ACLP9L_10585 [Thermoguttaceae bacterium]